MGVLANAQQILASKKEFGRAAKRGDLTTLKNLIAKYTYNGEIAPHLVVAEAIWRAIEGEISNTCDILDFLFPYLEMGEQQRQQQSQYEWCWWYSAVYMNKLDVIEFLTHKYPAKDHSEEISQAIRYKRSAILSLLLANTTHFDAKKAIDLFTNSEYPSTLAQIWIPYLTQEEIDWALVLSATKKSSEIIKVLAPLCSVAVCEHAILEALVSEHDCGVCIEILRPFVGQTALYGVYREFAQQQTRSNQETLALLPMLDVNRWNGVVTHNAYTCDTVKLLYSYCNPYQTQGLLSIKHASEMACQWTKVIVEDEQNADPHRMEQLRQMKRDAQPILDFIQAVKDGNISYIASAAVDEDTVNGAFVMPMLWGNDSPKHLLARGIWDESMWGALIEAIDHKSPHLLWLIEQYDYIQCPKRKIYAQIVADKLLTKRLFEAYDRMSMMFSYIDTNALALSCSYKNQMKAVHTVLKGSPPTDDILEHLLENGRYRLMKMIVENYPDLNYFPAIKIGLNQIMRGSTFIQNQRYKTLCMLGKQHIKTHPQDLAPLLHHLIKLRVVDVDALDLLPYADDDLRAQLFITSARTDYNFDSLFSTQYDPDIYTKAMMNAAYYGQTTYVDQLWEYTDLDATHACILETGEISPAAIYFYQRLDEQRSREQQRELLLEAAEQECEHQKTSRKL